MNKHLFYVILLGLTPGLQAMSSSSSAPMSHLAPDAPQQFNELINVIGAEKDARALEIIEEGGLNLNMHTPPNANGDYETPLTLAVVKNRLPVVAALIEAGADLNTPEATGYTPINRAAAWGFVDIVKMLAARPEVDVNKAANDGERPLTVAVLRWRPDISRKIVEILLARKDLDLDTQAPAALSTARHFGDEGIIQLIHKELAKRKQAKQ